MTVVQFDTIRKRLDKKVKEMDELDQTLCSLEQQYAQKQYEYNNLVRQLHDRDGEVPEKYLQYCSIVVIRIDPEEGLKIELDTGEIQ